MRQNCMIVVLLATVTLVAGCDLIESWLKPSVVSLSMANNGREVTVSVGQILEITLGANPTTGYLWEIAELDAAYLQQLGEAEFRPESGLPGAGGEVIFRIEAISTGLTFLKLIHHRPWEDADPLETFSIDLVIE